MHADHHNVLAGRRVLVVEDEYLVALHHRDLLEASGCEVIGPAGSIPEALALIAAEPPDAVLLDVNIKGTTSEAVAEALTAIGRPFVVATAYNARTLGEALASAPLLSKPIDRTKLKQVFTDLFG
jgi:CheY-like chemotaxis protein